MHLLLFWFCCLPLAIYGQNHKPFTSNSVEVGIGYAGVESGTWLSYVEYTRRLSPFVHIGLSGAYTKGAQDNRPWYDGTTTVWMGDVTVYMLPFYKLKSSSLLRTLLHLQTLKVGIGGGFRNIDQFTTVGSSTIGSNQPDQFSSFTKNTNGIGFNFIIEQDIVVVKNWFLAARVALHNYDGGEAAEFFGVNTGIKF